MAIAVTSAAGIALRSRTSPSASRTALIGSSSRPSSSVRAIGTSESYPGRSTGITAIDSDDSRSLARRHCSRRRVSAPIAEVLAGSSVPAAWMRASTMFSRAESTLSPEKSATRRVSPIGDRSARARLIDVPLLPKSHSTSTPRAGRPGSACNAASAAAESPMMAGVIPFEDSGLDRKAPRNAPTVAGPQCDGAAMTTRVGVWPSSTARAIASRAAATRLSPRCEEPSAAMSGTGSPTRSTNPRNTTPG